MDPLLTEFLFAPDYYTDSTSAGKQLTPQLVQLVTSTWCTQIETLQLLDSVAGKLGIERTQKYLRQPLQVRLLVPAWRVVSRVCQRQALFQSNCGQARTFLVRLEFLQVCWK